MTGSRPRGGREPVVDLDQTSTLFVQLTELLLKLLHLCLYLGDRSVIPCPLSKFSAAFQNLHRQFYALVRMRHLGISKRVFL